MSGRIIYLGTGSPLGPAMPPNRGGDSTSLHWTELRDEYGRLCARVEPRHFLLEVRRNQVTMIFDLREYFDDTGTASSVARSIERTGAVKANGT